MSRCFPFPPPGYEKKARIIDADLLKKEKHKEKKHKKEDKNKREGKDRKERDRSGSKHRDRKERKEKSKDKKEKERDKDKSKISSSQGLIPAQVESCNGVKLNNKERAGGKDQDIASNGKNQSKQLYAQIGERSVDNCRSNEGVTDRFVLDFCSRIKDEGKGSASQSMERIPFSGRTNHDRIVKEETEIKEKDKKVDIRKIDGQGVWSNAITRVNSMVQNTAGKEKNENKGVYIGGGFQNRTEEVQRTLERNVVESEEKQGNDRKDKEKEKKSHGKDKEREKEKKKERNAKERSEKEIRDRNKVQDSIKNGHVLVSQNTKLPPLLPVGNDGDRNTVLEGNLKKRKDIEANGFVHENHVVPNKKLRPTPPHPSLENGRKLEPWLAPVLHTPDRKLPPKNLVKANSNDDRVNGTTGIQPFPISLEKTSSSSKTKGSQIAQASTELPHPDSKYLSEVLSVPKIEEWCGFDVDDQEWLFSSKACSSGTVGPTKEASKTPRVWAEAVQIESANICALPYVVPF